MANEKTAQRIITVSYCDNHPVIQASRKVIDDDGVPVYMCKSCYLTHLMHDLPVEKVDDFENYQSNFWDATAHQPLFE
jgi:Zn-finger protein